MINMQNVLKTFQTDRPISLADTEKKLKIFSDFID